MGLTTSWATKKRFDVLTTSLAKPFKIMTILDLMCFDKSIFEIRFIHARVQQNSFRGCAAESASAVLR
jgi:hypothetical protein